MAKRRGNGEGSFRLRGKTWQLSTMVGYYSDGRKKVKTFSGRTQAECKKKMRAYLNDIESGLCVDVDYTFSQYADIFMNIHQQDIKPATIQSYKYTLRILNQYLGHREIASLKPIDVDLMLQQLRESGRSDSAIAQARGLLYMVMQHAEGNGYIRSNPVRFAKKMRKRPPNEKECFTEEEIELLMVHLPQDRIGWSIRILLACGLRVQELLALQKHHIAPDGSTITVCQAVSRVVGTTQVSTPKSFDSYRTVPVPKNVRYCAIALRNIDAEFIWSVGDSHKPCNPSTFNKEYRRAIEAIPGVRYLPPHNCRHTYVTTLLRLGVPMPIIQSLVGHSTVLMTKHYSHIDLAMMQSAVAKYSEMLPCMEVPEE